MPENNATSHSTRKIKVTQDRDGQRIDNFLLAYLKGVPRSYVYRIVRTGEVRVNGGRKKPAYKMQTGDLIRIPPVNIEPVERRAVPVSAYAALRDDILLENEDFLVLNKPSGLAVHSGSNILYGVIEIMQQHHAGGARIELAHRIDRGTSGCLLLAKGRRALETLHNAFRHNRMEKSYLAFIGGALRDPVTTVRKPLSKVQVDGENRVVVDAHGKAAHSDFMFAKRYPLGSLMKVTTRTGRMHQIRVHAQSLGHPLVEDHKYGDKGVNRRCKELGLKRIFLHAAELKFEHNDEAFHIVAPLPRSLLDFLDRQVDVEHNSGCRLSGGYGSL